MHAVPPKAWDEWAKPEEQALKKKLQEEGKWSAYFGDRNSEMVFIGVNLNKPLMEKKLTEALLTEKESEALGGINGWRTLEDPFFGGKCAEEFFVLSQAPWWWQRPSFHTVL